MALFASNIIKDLKVEVDEINSSIDDYDWNEKLRLETLYKKIMLESALDEFKKRFSPF